MTREAHILNRLREVCSYPLPLPGAGSTPERHAAFFAIAEEDVSLAKLAEAHFDALAIIAEARLTAVPEAIYAVWASEVPGHALEVKEFGGSLEVNGDKPFCSGGSLIDRALVTVGRPRSLLVEIDLRRVRESVTFDLSQWSTEAFRVTETGAVAFANAPVERVVGGEGFYLGRSGFWNGACGPAACWAGGAAGLLHFARKSKRDDAHTAAHRAAMEANVWAMRVLLAETGREIDAAPNEAEAAQVRALRLRHAIDMLAGDTLCRFARAYGPHPLAMDAEMSRRHAETGIFLRQCHGERDLETLGRCLHA